MLNLTLSPLKSPTEKDDLIHPYPILIPSYPILSLRLWKVDRKSWDGSDQCLVHVSASKALLCLRKMDGINLQVGNQMRPSHGLAFNISSTGNGVISRYFMIFSDVESIGISSLAVQNHASHDIGCHWFQDQGMGGCECQTCTHGWIGNLYISTVLTISTAPCCLNTATSCTHMNTKVQNPSLRFWSKMPSQWHEPTRHVPSLWGMPLPKPCLSVAIDAETSGWGSMLNSLSGWIGHAELLQWL